LLLCRFAGHKLLVQANQARALKQLKSARMGKEGITRRFLLHCGDLLDHHELLRVRVAERE